MKIATIVKIGCDDLILRIHFLKDIYLPILKYPILGMTATLIKVYPITYMKLPLALANLLPSPALDGG
jgi:membrane-associated protease RseP (regulator of RpoE activity)